MVPPLPLALAPAPAPGPPAGTAVRSISGGGSPEEITVSVQRVVGIALLAQLVVGIAVLAQLVVGIAVTVQNAALDQVSRMQPAPVPHM